MTMSDDLCWSRILTKQLLPRLFLLLTGRWLAIGIAKQARGVLSRGAARSALSWM